MFPSKVRFFILSTTTNFTFSNKNMTEQLFMNTLTKISEKAKVIKKESSGYARTLRLNHYILKKEYTLTLCIISYLLQ